MNRSNLSRTLAVVVAVVVLGVAACSDDDGAEATSQTGRTTAPAESGGGAPESIDGSGSESESSDNPTTFGYRIDGDPGTTVKIQTLAESEVGPQELSQTSRITDEPRWLLYTIWITAGEITFELTEGEVATVEILRGHTIDPEDPFAGIEVVEVLEVATVTADAPVTVTFP